MIDVDARIAKQQIGKLLLAVPPEGRKYLAPILEAGLEKLKANHPSKDKPNG